MTPQQKYDSLKSDFEKVVEKIKLHSAHVSIYQVRVWKKYRAQLSDKLEALKVQINLINKTREEQLHNSYRSILRSGRQ